MPTVSIVSENGWKNAPLTDPPILGSIAPDDRGRGLTETSIKSNGSVCRKGSRLIAGPLDGVRGTPLEALQQRRLASQLRRLGEVVGAVQGESEQCPGQGVAGREREALGEQGLGLGQPVGQQRDGPPLGEGVDVVRIVRQDPGVGGRAIASYRTWRTLRR
jgi:hypothetical protein